MGDAHPVCGTATTGGFALVGANLFVHWWNAWRAAKGCDETPRASGLATQRRYTRKVTENTENLILERLRGIRADTGAIKDDIP
jgi:hypothetical protein